MDFKLKKHLSRGDISRLKGNHYEQVKEKYPLEGFIDTHLHTSPDVKPRILNDVQAAFMASKEKMGGIILKSHVESTVGRARLTEMVTGIKVIGGLTLNSSVGGLNPAAVENSALMGGKIVWFPTISHGALNLDLELIEDILQIIVRNDMVLATGHLNPAEIFELLDMAHSMGIWKILVNHPFTQVVGANIEEQKEMARYAYLEHCYVACMDKHDKIDPEVISQGIKDIGSDKCVMATDFGQPHNPYPVVGLKMFVDKMLDLEISLDDIVVMCKINPFKLFFE